VRRFLLRFLPVCSLVLISGCGEDVCTRYCTAFADCYEALGWGAGWEDSFEDCEIMHSPRTIHALEACEMVLDDIEAIGCESL
jgi:hypothetical protein